MAKPHIDSAARDDLDYSVHRASSAAKIHYDMPMSSVWRPKNRRRTGIMAAKILILLTRLIVPEVALVEQQNIGSISSQDYLH